MLTELDFKKRAILVGIGNNYKKYKNILEKYFDTVDKLDNAYMDKDDSVHPIERIAEYNENQYDYVVVMPDSYKDIERQLLETGVPENKIFVFYESPIRYRNYSFGTYCYGQHYDDLIVSAIFSQIEIDHISYLDLGVNHPYLSNNTMLFYEKGMRGGLVEANPFLIDRISYARPNDIILNVGIGIEEGYMEFYSFGKDSGLNTFLR